VSCIRSQFSFSHASLPSILDLPLSTRINTIYCSNRKHHLLLLLPNRFSQNFSLKAVFSSSHSTRTNVNLKILTSPSFISTIFPEKQFYQTFMKTGSALPINLLLEPKKIKTFMRTCVS
jgi:hypothetical protein